VHGTYPQEFKYAVVTPRLKRPNLVSLKTGWGQRNTNQLHLF